MLIRHAITGANAAIQEEAENISWSDEETSVATDEKLTESSTSNIDLPTEIPPPNSLLRKSEEISTPPETTDNQSETLPLKESNPKEIDDEEINRLLNEDIEISLDDIKDIDIEDYDDWE